jgi:hypothetical protein
VVTIEKQINQMVKVFEPARDYAPTPSATPPEATWQAVTAATSFLIDPWAPLFERPWFSSPLRDQFAIASDYSRAITKLAAAHNVPLEDVHPGQGKLFVLE